ncbi:phenylalanine--tRNA ligase beta subunit-related protein [Streptomyces roseolilacinus]|uniref:phenylalanine--tRNA ligase beta subunit-related protein n=1 Tax=Streptomyces roseolilacinus TaxID=66904 RepID=UPI001671F994|nr:phenylalanine--tRNA ligase beta subunit-related protein [Streptomyces roseolilacinus]
MSLSLLRHYRPQLPASTRSACEVLEDVGIEVKRLQETPRGEVLTLELLANRGDHHCYAGIARELGGRFEVPTPLPPQATLTADEAPAPVVDTPTCLAFGVARCTLADGDGSRLPEEWAEALRLNDEYTGLLAVDAGNTVGREIGQPLHVYDADRLVGPLRVRLSEEGETARLLDGDEPVPIPAGLTVVADDEGIVAVAGVMGTRRAAVTDSTRHLLVESALFDPVAVRRAARALQRQTAAATRFERGADPTLVRVGAARAVALLDEWGALAPDSPRTWAESACPPDARLAPREIRLDLDSLDTYYAVPFDPAAVERRLTCLGFSVRKDDEEDRVLRAGVPGHRLWDVFNPECLYEEIGRMWSFDSFPAVLPEAGGGKAPTPRQRTRVALEQVLVGYGFFEVVTDGFYSRTAHERLGVPAGSSLTRHVELRNAIDRNFSLLKNNALLQGLDIADYNQRRSLTCGKYFEFTHLFEAVDTDDHRERPVLWGMLWGEETYGAWQGGGQGFDFWYLKGVLEEMAHACGSRFAFARTVDEPSPVAELMHPTRSAHLLVDGRVAGLCGEVHPSVTANWKLRTDRVLYFELDWTALIAAFGTATAEPVDDMPEHPLLRRDVAFHLPVGLTADEVREEMEAVSPLELAWSRVTDLYENGDVRAHTFELAFENDNTITAEQVNGAMSAITSHVLDAFRKRGVYQR